MKDLLEKLNELEKDLKTVNESVDPLSEMASMNISMNGENADEVAQLVSIMKSGGAPDAGPVGPKDMPKMDMPMSKAIDIIKGPQMAPDMGPDMGPDMDDMPLKGSGCGGEEICHCRRSYKIIYAVCGSRMVQIPFTERWGAGACRKCG